MNLKHLGKTEDKIRIASNKLAKGLLGIRIPYNIKWITEFVFNNYKNISYESFSDEVKNLYVLEKLFQFKKKNTDFDYYVILNPYFNDENLRYLSDGSLQGIVLEYNTKVNGHFEKFYFLLDVVLGRIGDNKSSYEKFASKLNLELEPLAERLDINNTGTLLFLPKIMNANHNLDSILRKSPGTSIVDIPFNENSLEEMYKTLSINSPSNIRY